MNTTLRKKSKVRWIVAALMWAAIAINYLDRAIIAAVSPALITEFSLTAEEMGWIMSGFFWTYALLQIPAGWLADKIGQKKTLGWAVGWWSVATAMMGVATGFKSLLVMRFILGAGEAAAYPSNAGIASRWFPDKERSFVSGLFDSASKFGGAVAMPLIVWLIVMFDWRITFIIFGSLGIIWVLFWLVFYTDTPEKHKMINQEEIDYIRAGQAQKHSGEPAMRWYQLLRYKSIWAMCLGFFTINYTSYFFITWLPAYLVKEKGMDLLTMGFVAALPLLCGMVAEITAGWASDRMHSSGRYSLTFTRKSILILGMALALCVGFAPLTDSVVLTVILLCVARSGTAIAASQVWSLPGDVAPNNMVSTVAGLQNTISNFGGAFGPIITGIIVTTTGNFTWALIFSAILLGLGMLNYIFLLGKVKQIT
ncbi:MFS transporter [Klebsiella sp. BIGb0407]|uniref:MFS transporter n=1 Tax=Klebsiella sp. BIGb0407 TaxID=2940603 RepID=UPI00216861A5|nr:MFS transporter [Klebsiella sp. BIGb0407]MCS3430623.1 ACS family glucarate transporter-like MFS transporter [Klebsiella sp. BIGb0407]